MFCDVESHPETISIHIFNSCGDSAIECNHLWPGIICTCIALQTSDTHTTERQEAVQRMKG